MNMEPTTTTTGVCACALTVSLGLATLAIASPRSAYTADLSQNWRETTATRERISLNGIWQLKPILEPVAEPTPSGLSGDWGYSKVPGSWTDNQFEVWDSSGTLTDQWQGKALKGLPQAWYRREFVIPAAWKSKRVFLQIGDIQATGTVFVNGRPVGNCEWFVPADLDITAVAKIGEKNEVCILVAGMLADLRYAGVATAVFGNVHSGIPDDVSLECKAATTIDEVQIIPSVRKKTLVVNVVLKQAVQERKNYLLKLAVLDKTGREVKQLQHSVSPGDPPAIALSIPWETPHLWSLDDPYLYTVQARLEADSQLVDEPYPVKFGFREFWIEGRDFILNGKRMFAVLDSNYNPMRSFYTANSEELIRNFYAISKKMQVMGYRECVLGNTQILNCPKAYKIADEMGVFIDAPLFSPLLYDSISGVMEDWKTAEYRALYEKRIGAYLKRFRNHPSIMLWNLDFYTLHTVWRNHPKKLASYVPHYGETDEYFRMWKEMVAICNKYDPSREIYCYASGNVGPLNTMFHFGNPGTPLQETENWPSGWAKTGQKPLVVVEAGFPYLPFTNSNKKMLDANQSERLDPEYAAMFFGDRGYDFSSTDEIEKNAIFNNAFQENRKYLMERIVRGWRTYRVSGIWPHAECMYGWTYRDEIIKDDDLTLPGAKPCRKASSEGGFIVVPTGLNDYGQKLAEAFSPLAFYIGGSPAPTTKKHSYFAGETITKQIVCMNDSFADAACRLKIVVTDRNQQAIYRTDKDVTIKQGQQLLVPISFTAPLIEKPKEDLTITLAVSNDTQVLTQDTFNCQIFNRNLLKNTPGKGKNIVLFDATGETAKAFDKMGVTYKKLTDATALKKADLLVVGKNSLADFGRHSTEYGIAEKVKNGLNMLWFEQGGENAKTYPFPLNERSFREAYIQTEGHPLLKDLSGDDFKNWHGASDLTAPYPEPDPSTETTNPDKFWKWGNEGIVATWVFDKPCFGNFRPVLKCGFDLRETPLLEYANPSSGRVILSQLDLIGRCGRDPVATVMFRNLIEYGGAQKTLAAGKAAYLGGKYTQDILDRISLPYIKLATLAKIPASVLIIDEMLNPIQKEAAASFIKTGGTVVWLPFANQGEIVPGLTLTATDVYRAKVLAASRSVLQGITPSELFLKKTVRLGVISGALSEKAVFATCPNLVSEIPYGKGRVIVDTIDPNKLGNTRALPKAYRILCAILTDLGIRLDDKFGDNAIGGVGIDLTKLDWKAQIDPADAGLSEKWQARGYDDSTWKKVRSPDPIKKYFPGANPAFRKGTADNKKHPNGGYFWYRCHLKVPAEYKDSVLKLEVGAIGDSDWTYLNGKQIGKTSKDRSSHVAAKRIYSMPPSFVKFGEENVIAIRVLDDNPVGGILGLPVRVTAENSVKDNYYLDGKYETDDPYMWYPY